jgi:hypothetical protein
VHPLESHLHELDLIRASGAGVPETSGYGALATLLNAVGGTLKPKVRCVINLHNQGAGLPDGGLFTADQFQKGIDLKPLPGQLPGRGAIEVKSVAADLDQLAASEQIAKYLVKYGQVLVTNYREFLLVTQGPGGKPPPGERYHLAESETAFWAAAAHPHKTAAERGERLIEYLKRVMLHPAPLTAPADLAWFLASYARDAHARVDAQADLPALASLRAAMENALGMAFQGPEGEHFFRSTLVQTLFYGVFAAWVLWHKENPARAGRFDWRLASYYLNVPVIQALFEQVSAHSKLKVLGLIEPLDWAGATLNRVDRAAFFAKFEEEHAVQYFYEPFLQAYDPELRKQLGVWYTPPEIIRYMVARVDAVLRGELGVADGLADPDVYVLDPCCGTGGFLVATLAHIAETLVANGEEGLLAAKLKQAATQRVFGFEILPAPLVIAHMQIGLALSRRGAPLAEDERAGVYLTNALIGWEPPDAQKEKALQELLIPFPELAHERDAAREVKRHGKILVVLGNPPYNGFAGVSPQEEGGLVEPYKVGLNTEWGIKKFNLDDLYIRFFRLAERRIAEMTGRGVVCYISNFSYLGDPSFVVLRRRFLGGFDAFWFDCLNGDSRETGKLTPDGKPDPSIFSTEYNREGIRVGTAIGLMVRKTKRDEQPAVRFRQFWGVTKRADLTQTFEVSETSKVSAPRYELVRPDPANRYSFRPSEVAAHYLAWPKLVDFCGETPVSGLQEMRKGALMAFERAVLEKRMRVYYDPKIDWNIFRTMGAGLTENGGRFDAEMCRSKVLKAENFDPDRLMRYALYPFDLRWCYHSSVRPL